MFDARELKYGFCAQHWTANRQNNRREKIIYGILLYYLAMGPTNTGAPKLYHASNGETIPNLFYTRATLRAVTPIFPN